MVDARDCRNLPLAATGRPKRNRNQAHQRPPARDTVQHPGAARFPDAGSPICTRARARWASRRSAAGRRKCGSRRRRKPALAAIRANLKALKIARGFAVEERGTGALLERLAKTAQESGGLARPVYLDPPWEAEAEYEKTLHLLGSARGRAMLAPGALVVAEHSSKTPLAERYGELVQTRTLKQGDAALSFYAVAAE